ncbi:7310_t:CDS:2 [Funneliformis geosporum]|uniref:4436_t:CDS:1 n=1 Tax=Funneliformis geosporum TaxID=1117311 RepID=A0A9W4SI09_9GLOM|nr:4436_t:CDS:2 [Funneliformis geosporum]CAI2177871.1 7310_t:CDS:2 [Funneliformis geosporum]
MEHKAIELYTPKYYYTCALGGVLACGLTHTFVTPLDLVKCRRQVDAQLYKGNFDGWSKIYRGEGTRGLYTGFGPTFIGYSFQGAAKYGFYELFKKKYSDFAGEETAHKYRTIIYLAASASAEVLADIALCPWEALKVRMQTSTQPFAKSTSEGFNKILKQEGLNGFYKGLTPLWARQVPYTMMKFASFEKTVEFIYNSLGKPKQDYNKLEQLGVSFLGGYIAGVFCAIVSHPADTLVSKLNNVKKAEGESTGALSLRLMKELGFKGIWRGLGTRVIMIEIVKQIQKKSSSSSTNEERSIWTQIGFEGVHESQSFGKHDDIQWILQSYGFDFRDDVDAELYFW